MRLQTWAVLGTACLRVAHICGELDLSNMRCWSGLRLCAVWEASTEAALLTLELTRRWGMVAMLRDST